MQHRDAIERVAVECAEDLAADGVVYAEVRFAPELHTEAGPHARRGGRGRARRLRPRRRPAPTSRSTPSARRCAPRRAACEIAELAVRYRDAGVVGFDIAGAEAGYPPTRHLDAFQYVMRENFHTTIHAGEAFGLPSHLGGGAVLRRRAPRPRRAHRRRHHRRRPATSSSAGWPSYVRDRAHPARAVPDVERQHRRVRVDRRAPDRAAAPAAVPGHGQHRQPADERHVDDATRSCSCRDAFGWGLDDFEWLTINAMKSAFAPFHERLRIINGLIKPRYALLEAERVGVSRHRLFPRPSRNRSLAAAQVPPGLGGFQPIVRPIGAAARPLRRDRHARGMSPGGSHGAAFRRCASSIVTAPSSS